MSDHVHAAWRYTKGEQRNCPQCCSLASADRAGIKAKHKAALPHNVDRLPHGEYSTYQNHACHCGPCRRANTEYRAGRRRGGKN